MWPFRGLSFNGYSAPGWKLQRASVDIVEAQGMIKEVDNFYRKEREDYDTNFSVFMYKVFQWLRRWVVLLKFPEFLRDNSIALTWCCFSNGTSRFLHWITSLWVSMNSFHLQRQLPHHFLASFQVFSTRRMWTSRQLLLNTVTISITKVIRNGACAVKRPILINGTGTEANFPRCDN